MSLRERVAAGVALVAATVVPAGCELAGPPPTTHGFTVSVEDGVEIALTTGGPKYEGEIFEYERVADLRPDPDVEESFMYSPQWMTSSADGRIFVGDMGDAQVVVFSAEGEYLGKTTPPGWPQPSHGKLLTMWDDPGAGEEYPVVYRIIPAVPDLEY